MRQTFGQVQERMPARPGQEGMAPIPATAKEIPYDYVAKFTLRGEGGHRVQDVINISTEGAFVAVAIGYSFIPAKMQDPTSPGGPLLKKLSELPPSGNSTVDWLFDKIIKPFAEPRMLIQCLAVRLCGIDFKYSIVDSGSGRELQNQPIHNIAGLGEATGDRPFRPLAKPMLFMPRSTIRFEIQEISEGVPYVGAELFIVLHGYKVLGYGTALP